MSFNISQTLPDGSWDYKASAFGEQPSIVLAALGAVVYFIVFAIHVGQAVRYKTRYMTVAIIGALAECVGYTLRIFCINDPFNSTLYSKMYTLIIVSPVLIAAMQYLLLEKIIHFSYPTASPVKHSLITRAFVIGDIIAFLVQVGGSVILLSSKVTDTPKINLGINILMFGLCIQVVAFAAYLAIALVFFNRAKKLELENKPIFGERCPGPVENQDWKRLFKALMISASFVMIRSVFRIIEFAFGFGGPVATNEKYSYVFDFVPIALALIAFNIVHPGLVLRSGIDTVEGAREEGKGAK